MTAAYLTEIEIVRELRLPEKVGRIKMAMWKKEPSFPAPEPGTAGRRYWPEVEQWLRRYHHLDSGESHSGESHSGESRRTPSELASRGKENFDEWRAQRAARKTRKTGRARDAGTDLPPAGIGLASNVVAPERFGRPRVQPDDVSSVADKPDPPRAA